MGIFPIVNFPYAMVNPTAAVACDAQRASYANETNVNSTVTNSSLFKNGAQKPIKSNPCFQVITLRVAGVEQFSTLFLIRNHFTSNLVLDSQKFKRLLELQGKS